VSLPSGRHRQRKPAANRGVTCDCGGKHSTGQAYKGGPNSGVFLQITAEPNFDLAIPGHKTSFGVIEAAQARGDFRVLAERSRRALHAHITHDPAAGLAAIGKAARLALP
jgi:transaldolase/glucose-6-phosphate isomerase